MKRMAPVALMIAATLAMSGCGDTPDPVAPVTSATATPDTTEASAEPTTEPSTVPVPSPTPEVLPPEPEAVEMTVEQTLAEITESTFNDIVRVTPEASKKFDDLWVYIEEEGQRRWEEQNPGGVYLPDSGSMMFSLEEEAQLDRETWRTAEFEAAFDNISFTFWTADDPARRFMALTMYGVSSMMPGLHNYQIEVPETAFEAGYEEDTYTLATSEIVITRDGNVVDADFGYFDLLFFKKINGEWKITPEDEGIVFPFESLSL